MKRRTQSKRRHVRRRIPYAKNKKQNNYCPKVQKRPSDFWYDPEDEDSKYWRMEWYENKGALTD